jgi:PII-like signaling protein
VLHTANLLRLSEDLPVVIEVVDTDERIQQQLVPMLEEMITEGLVTMEKVRVLKYAAPPADAAS